MCQDPKEARVAAAAISIAKLDGTSITAHEASTISRWRTLSIRDP